MATGLTDQDRRRIKDALDHSVSANTPGMYASTWRSFEEWAQARGVPALPDSPELVAACLLELAEGRKLSVRQAKLRNAEALAATGMLGVVPQ